MDKLTTRQLRAALIAMGKIEGAPSGYVSIKTAVFMLEKLPWILKKIEQKG